jgi:hypothetical protein
MKALAVLAAALAVAGGALAAVLAEESSRSAASRLDLSRSEGRSASFLSGFDFSRLYVSLAPDEIRSIDQPLFDPPARVRGLLPSQDLVIGLAVGGEAHAYPVNVLSLHEVVNDVVGGRAVAITWCPLCSSALGFDRMIRRRILTFGVSGYLYHANQVLFDRETGSLWSQLLGGAVTGPLRGTKLTDVPVVETTWGEWLAAHPRTLVLSIRRDSRAQDFLRPISYASYRGAEESDDPYESYNQKVTYYFSRVVRGVVDGSRVLGVVARGRAKAYPLTVLARRRAFDDAVGGEAVLVTYDDRALVGSVFSRRLGGRALRFWFTHARLVDRETGTRWSLDGRALAGPLAGTALVRLPSTMLFWFAWRAFHPATAIAR